MVNEYVAKAARYAEEAVTRGGNLIVSELTKKTCRAFLEDLSKSKRKTFPWELDEARAAAPCEFVERMPHVKGKWQGTLIALELWQAFWIVAIWGFVGKTSGLRRYVEAYIEVSRKNAKSTVGAAIGNYMTVGDGEKGAEVYCGATTEQQALEVFRPAWLMVRRSEWLRERYGLEVGGKSLPRSIYRESDGSRFQPLIGNPGDGPSPSLALVDEYHEHETDAMVETMLTGMGAREQPLLLVITTAGDDETGPCYAMRQRVVDQLNGTKPDPRLFGLIYTTDEGTDWKSEEALWMANPNCEVSVALEYLQRQQQVAINNPRKQSAFLRKNLNVWTSASDPWLNMEFWNRSAVEGLGTSRFTGERCSVGVMMPSKTRLACVAVVFREELPEDENAPEPEEGEERRKRWRLIACGHRLFVPRTTAEDPDQAHLLEWEASGALEVVPGARLYPETLEDVVRELSKHHEVEVHYAQQNGLDVMAERLEGEGLVCVETNLQARYMSEQMKELEALLADGTVEQDGNPAMARSLASVVAKEGANHLLFPLKATTQADITAAFALLLAVAGAIRGVEEVGEVGWMLG